MLVVTGLAEKDGREEKRREEKRREEKRREVKKTKRGRGKQTVDGIIK